MGGGEGTGQGCGGRGWVAPEVGARAAAVLLVERLEAPPSSFGVSADPVPYLGRARPPGRLGLLPPPPPPPRRRPAPLLRAPLLRLRAPAPSSIPSNLPPAPRG